MLVVDNSVMIEWYNDSPLHSKAIKLTPQAMQEGIIVPDIWKYEFTNVIKKCATQIKSINPKQVNQIFEEILTFPLTIDDIDVSRFFDTLYPLSKNYKLTVYDASYLDVAARHNAPLATFDKNMITAAKRLNLELFKDW